MVFSSFKLVIILICSFIIMVFDLINTNIYFFIATKPDSNAAKVWMLSADDTLDENVELINEDDLLDENDLKKPDPSTLKGNFLIFCWTKNKNSKNKIPHRN